MLRKDPFLTGYVYHIYNRGVNKMDIFKNPGDYSRFMFTLDKFNSKDVKRNTQRNFENHSKNNTRASKEEKEPLVKIVDHCLMPNHYHLLVEQLVDGGISKFLQKAMTGYTMYFNLKNERSGVLFQGRTKSKLVDTDEYRMWLKDYFAFNPLDLCEPNWKERGVKDKKKAIKFLQNYKWRSEYDYSTKDVSVLLDQVSRFNLDT
jgi:putative transposase